MNIFRTLHRSILVLFAVVVISIVFLVHISVSNIVAEQSRAHQKSISPAFSLITNQILKPLHISEALSASQEIRELMSEQPDNEELIYDTLERLTNEFNLSFFIASEISRTQYFSNRNKIPLVEGDVSWYFKYKDRTEDAVADIGKWEDTHFYIDIKIFDDNGEFLGFYGIGKSLKSFISVFNTYKQEYGYDFIFVDDGGDIMLSSDPKLNASNSHFKRINDLPWFTELPASVRDSRNLNNRLVTINQKDYLIAEVRLEQFNWTMYLLSPLDSRQAEISQGFIYSIVTLLVIIFSLFFLVYNLLYFFRKQVDKNNNYEREVLGLPGRIALQAQFEEISNSAMNISVIVFEVDNQTNISNRFGSDVEKLVLERIVNTVNQFKDPKDILGRWTPPKLILFLPNKTGQEAKEFAQQMRYNIDNLTELEQYSGLHATVSFGVTHTIDARTLTEAIVFAEDALYQAQQEGGNLVRTCFPRKT